MKVIDLLNKIANGEEYPKIKFNNNIYKYHDKEHGYCRHYQDNTYICLETDYYLFDILNDEVEIIEEKEETKPITKEIEALGYACGEIQKCFTNGWNKSLKNEPLTEEDKKIEKININGYDEILDTTLASKINEIIDKINEDK